MAIYGIAVWWGCGLCSLTSPPSNSYGYLRAAAAAAVSVVVVVAAAVKNNNQTDVVSQDDDDVPVAMFVCLGVGGYLILVIVIIVVYRSLKGQGSCQCVTCDCRCDHCGSCCQFSSNSGGCCGLCFKHGKSCSSCCEDCSLSSFFSGLCGAFKCCHGCCEGDNSCRPSCSSCCEDCNSPTSCLPSCSCSSSAEEGCVCLCFEIKLHKGGKQDKPYRDGTSAPVGQGRKPNTVGAGGMGSDGQLFSTHSPPLSQSYVNGGLDKQQRNHQPCSFDGPIVTDVVSVKGQQFQGQGDTQLKSRSVHLALPMEAITDNQHLHRVQVSFSSANSKEGRTRRKLPAPPDKESSSTGTRTDKTHSNSSDADLSASEGSHRLSSRIRRSLHAGRRSQRYPNKFLVNAESTCQDSRADVSSSIHKSSKVGSLNTRNSEVSNSTQSTNLSSGASSGQQKSFLLSSRSSGQQTSKLSTTSTQTLPKPREFL
ncbi:hypothetical protein ElyMa_005136100 [Elysia marginata]|uniref:TNFR-Cys domain-containing protein n=1 Tax=Elysia marginata TaxID=1093978 RepID=A0AAV4JML9_9GAST|nr:hypothetical protein ElyMa_005136100 [Elysia marginata]